MPAIALAESRGDPNAKHTNRDGSVDQGLWQINSSNYSGSDIYDPNVNARWAIKLAEHGRGLRNWTTYVSGAYKRYLPKGGKYVPTGNGIFTTKNYAGTDQGVDFKGQGPIPALAAGKVTDVGKANIIEGGSYPYVVYQLDSGPYKGQFVYIAENFVPTVKRGQRLRPGQEVGKAVGSYPYIEIGFNKSGHGWNPVAPLNPNPHSPKAAGEKMKAYIYGVAGLNPGGGGGILGGVTSGLESAGSTALGLATNPIGTVGGWLGGAAGSVFSGVAKAIEKVGMEIVYAGSIAGGGLIFILGLVLIGADVGLSTRAGKIAAVAIPAGRIVKGATAAKTATQTSKAESNIPSRAEQRKEETHQANLKKIKAQTKKTKSDTKHRRKTVKEQSKAEEKAYYRGATDAASPTMAKIRREKKKS